MALRYGTDCDGGFNGLGLLTYDIYGGEISSGDKIEISLADGDDAAVSQSATLELQTTIYSGSISGGLEQAETLALTLVMLPSDGVTITQGVTVSQSATLTLGLTQYSGSVSTSTTALEQAAPLELSLSILSGSAGVVTQSPTLSQSATLSLTMSQLAGDVSISSSDTHPDVPYLLGTSRTITARGFQNEYGPYAQDYADGTDDYEETVIVIFLLDTDDEATMLDWWEAKAGKRFTWQPSWETSAMQYKMISASPTYQSPTLSYYTAVYELRH